jgi:hypothetical protein
VLSHGYDMSRTILSTNGYIEDKLDNFETISSNSGATKRKELSANSAIVQLMGKVRFDFNTTSKYLLNGIDLQLTFNSAKNSFFLMEKKTEAIFPIIKLHDASIILKRLNVNPDVMAAHYLTLQKNYFARYEYIKSEMKSFAISSGVEKFSVENMFTNNLPSIIVLAFTESSSYLGNYQKNCFFFHHFNITKVQLFVNEVPLPAINIDISKRWTVEGYHSLMSALNLYHSNDSILVTEEGFRKGLCFIGQSLQFSNPRLSDCHAINQNGSVRVEVTMSKPLEKNIVMLAYTEKNASFSVDKFRNVVMSS